MNAAGQGIAFEKTDWKVLLEKAKQENKNIFVVLSTVWCGPCRKLEKEVYPTDSVGNFMNKNFVSVHFDAEKDFGIQMKKKFAPEAYPTFLLFNSNGILIARGLGGATAQGFIERIKKMLENQYLATGYSDNMYAVYPDFYNKYILSGKAVNQQEVNTYFKNQKDWLTEINWTILSQFGREVPGFKQWRASHATDLKNLYGLETDADPMEILLNKLFTAVENKDVKAFNESITVMEKIYQTKPEPLLADRIFFQKLNFYAVTSNWTSFMDVVAAKKPITVLQKSLVVRFIIKYQKEDKVLLEKALSFIDTSKEKEDLSACALIYKKLDQPSKSKEKLNLLIKLFSADDVKEQIVSLAQQAENQKDPVFLDLALELLQEANPPDADLIKNRLLANYEFTTQQFVPFFAHMNAYLDLGGTVYPRQLLDYSYALYNNKMYKEAKEFLLKIPQVDKEGELDKESWVSLLEQVKMKLQQ